MGTTSTVELDFVIKADKASRDLTKLNTTVNKIGDSVSTSRLAFAGMISQVALNAITNASKFVKDLSVELVDVASDAKETGDKFNTIFKDISADANSAAEAMAESYGLAQDEAKGMIAATGDLLVGFGMSQRGALKLSVAINELAVDLASFQNVSTSRAAGALNSALVGEREALKSLGIVIKESNVQKQIQEDLAKGVVYVTDLEAKAMATYSLILKQTANAQGDFNRTRASYANQTKILTANLRDLKVEIGNELLPAFQELVTITNKALDANSDFIVSLSKVVIDSVVIFIKDLSSVMDDLSEGSAGAAEGVFRLNHALVALFSGGPISGTIVYIAELTAGILALNWALIKVTSAYGVLSGAVLAIGVTLAEMIALLGVGALLTFAGAIAGITAAIGGLGSILYIFIDNMRQIGIDTEKANKKVAEFRQSIVDLNNENLPFFENYGKATKDLINDIYGLENVLREVSDIEFKDGQYIFSNETMEEEEAKARGRLARSLADTDLRKKAHAAYTKFMLLNNDKIVSSHVAGALLTKQLEDDRQKTSVKSSEWAKATSDEKRKILSDDVEYEQALLREVIDEKLEGARTHLAELKIIREDAAVEEHARLDGDLAVGKEYLKKLREAETQLIYETDAKKLALMQVYDKKVLDLAKKTAAAKAKEDKKASDAKLRITKMEEESLTRIYYATGQAGIEAAGMIVGAFAKGADTQVAIAAAISSAQTLMSGYQAQALAPAMLGPILGPPAGALMLAQAQVNAALILGLGAVKMGTNQGFEEGGFVGGTSYTGDMVPIQVNSGEAVLTSVQQRNFMDLANGGTNNNNNNEAIIALANRPIIVEVAGEAIAHAVRNEIADGFVLGV